MTLTDNKREKAYALFASGVSSDKIASRLRLPVTSIRSLRAHWTMNNNASTSSRRSTRSSVQTVTLSRSQARRVAQAYNSGQRDEISLQISAS